MPVHWNAAMISPVEDLDGAPLLRKEVVLDQGHGDVTDARLHVSALGVFEATLNGTPVSDDVLSPGWSSYEWRIRYRTYDIAAQLRDSNVLGVALGNGWYRGRLTWSGRRALYGDRLGVIGQLEVTFEDGHRQVVGTDESWTAGPSAVVANDIYDGQTIDARRRDDSWTRPGATPNGWAGVEVLDFDTSLLTPYVGPPVVRQDTLRPVEIWTSPAGRTLVDFGQNLVGWLRFRVQGEPGATITIRHAEVLEDGELGSRPLRTALATDRFILSGNLDEFEPTLTFHGFRYAEVTGWPGELDADSLVAVVVHSDMYRTGYFECSDDMLNRLHSNVVWGTRGNFLDVPTDCPQRDERLGWTGDIAVFSPSASFLFDTSGFLRSWLADLAAEQQEDGSVPFVIPDVLNGASPAAAAWGDAATIVPWVVYQRFGDADLLRRQLPSMRGWVDRMASAADDRGLWVGGFQFGDWLDPTAPPDQPFLAKADPDVVATAHLARSAQVVADAAAVLGDEATATRYGDLAARVRQAFAEEYVTPAGRVLSDAATAYGMALEWALLPTAEQREGAGRRLADL